MLVWPWDQQGSCVPIVWIAAYCPLHGTEVTAKYSLPGGQCRQWVRQSYFPAAFPVACLHAELFLKQQLSPVRVTSMLFCSQGLHVTSLPCFRLLWTALNLPLLWILC